MDNRTRLFVVDWYKDEQPCLKVKSEVVEPLNNDLPESYDKESFFQGVSVNESLH